MKKCITFLFLLFLTYCYSQENYDVRKTKWFMSIKEVKASEYPMEPSDSLTPVGMSRGGIKYEKNLEYKNVKVGDYQTATIIYSFTNGKLTEVKYLMYGVATKSSKGTCENIISLYNKVLFSGFVFESLKNKGFVCDMGWYLVNCYPFYPVGNENCILVKDTVDKVEKAAAKVHCEQIGLNYSNSRTNVVFYFNQYQNYINFEKTKYRDPCDWDYYNTYYWLVFAPTWELKEEMKKNDF